MPGAWGHSGHSRHEPARTPPPAPGGAPSAAVRRGYRCPSLSPLLFSGFWLSSSETGEVWWGRTLLYVPSLPPLLFGAKNFGSPWSPIKRAACLPISKCFQPRCHLHINSVALVQGSISGFPHYLPEAVWGPSVERGEATSGCQVFHLWSLWSCLLTSPLLTLVTPKVTPLLSCPPIKVGHPPLRPASRGFFGNPEHTRAQQVP